MTDRFADTSGWACLASPRERFHADAVARYDETLRAGRRVVTTNWVLAELTALLTSPLRVPKPTQVALLDNVRRSPHVVVVTVDAALEAAAWARWRTRPDKDWSLVDCASFVLIEDRNLTDALTADHHFEQAGFVRLLK